MKTKSLSCLLCVSVAACLLCPSRLVTALITEHGVCEATGASIGRLCLT